MSSLSRRVASPKIDVTGFGRAEAQLAALEATLDRIGRKQLTVRAGFLGRLGGLFGGSGGPSLFSRDLGGLAGLGGGAASGGGSLAGGTFTGPLGLGAAILGGLALGPAAIPAFLGGGVGLGGALGAFKIGGAAEQKLLQMQQSLANATTPATRQHLRARIAAFQTSHADQLQFGGVAHTFTQSLQGTFLDALTSRSPGFSAGPGGQAGGSFLSGLVPILKQLSGFIKSIGPQLGDMFRASLPFVAAFVKIMEQFAKAVLPSVTQSLKIMQPDLPIIVQGFKLLSQGIAGFIVNLGPGMRASAVIFKGAMEVVKGFLQLAGLAASFFATSIVKTAEIVRAFARGIPPFFDRMFHAIAQIFDDLRHREAASWDNMWQETVGRTIRGISDVVGFFRGLPGRVMGAVRGLGSDLWSFGKNALQMIINGARSMLPSIGNFFKGVAGDVVGVFKKIWGWFSPSAVMYQGGKSLMEGLANGIRDHAHLAQRHAAAAARGTLPHGPLSGSAAAAQRYALAHLPAGWSWPALQALWNRESGWSAYAVNPSSGAYGIPQSLGHGHPYNLGDYIAQIAWGFRYIMGRYGSSQAAWAHEQAEGWYDHGGWLPPGRSIAVNNTGRPERILGPGEAVAGTVTVEWMVADRDLLAFLKKAIRISYGGNITAALGS